MKFRSSGFVEAKPRAVHATATNLALTLLLVALWSLTHRYKGLGGDAALYAIQALARIHPVLKNDLFLQNVTQDRYTIFSPFYAWWIGLIGLQNAAVALTIIFKVWFFAAAWILARSISSGYIAFLATAMLIITPGAYGAYEVFHYAEDWLTARSLGEALIITALALHFRGLKAIAGLFAIGALFVHPLMALPGLLLLLSLWAPVKTIIMGAVAGVLLSLSISVAAVALPPTTRFFSVMDANWLEVVRERSQFLFLQLWSADDWTLNARPFMTLALSALVLDNPQLRKLCLASMLVGAAGLVIAMIAGVIGPVAILLQGQAWRWEWVTTFTSVLLLVPTARQLWFEGKSGPLCCILLISGWAFTGADGALCAALALLLWLVRNRVTLRTRLHIRWATIVVGAGILVCMIANSWTIAASAATESGREPHMVTLGRKFMALDGVSVVLVWSLAYLIRTNKSLAIKTAIGTALITAAAWTLPGTFSDVGRIGAVPPPAEFADWHRAIPPGSNVFVAPYPNSATFAWFTLERPSYLSVDQSSGVVFSSQTALEVRRRSEVVLPVWDMSWQVLTRRNRRLSGAVKWSSMSRPLTRDSLVALCRDPRLNFVVAKEDVGFDPRRHLQPGGWKDWNLYDCRHVNRVDLPS
jgi:hypothetical protein